MTADFNRYHSWREWWDDVYWTHRSFGHWSGDIFAIMFGLVWQFLALYGLYRLVKELLP